MLTRPELKNPNSPTFPQLASPSSPSTCRLTFNPPSLKLQLQETEASIKMASNKFDAAFQATFASCIDHCLGLWSLTRINLQALQAKKELLEAKIQEERGRKLTERINNLILLQEKLPKGLTQTPCPSTLT